ncbi:MULTISPECIES: hypothetical protein [Rossellomorea]|uniref:hypothetical protein n=1 Tax=Rossellomorea TaxID=2837508 RepID=UPI001CCAF5A3|nr:MULTISPECIES: hypothetical protein [Rossellomorea]MCA0148547.1 hypothetical protein [Rossellomorea vietnamensis]WGG47596.1 hypothetical protein P8596_10490 [Rossellomorea sp. DA94]
MNVWEQYKKAVVLKMDVSTKEITKIIEYLSPADVYADKNASISFTAGTLIDICLYVGTRTEVLIFDCLSRKMIDYVSLPLFNDVHQVTLRKNGNLLVANTGLDLVAELDRKGQVVNLWDVMGDDLWNRFSPDIDYRKIANTNPHMSHPNFVFERNG